MEYKEIFCSFQMPIKLSFNPYACFLDTESCLSDSTSVESLSKWILLLLSISVEVSLSLSLKLLTLTLSSLIEVSVATNRLVNRVSVWLINVMILSTSVPSELEVNLFFSILAKLDSVFSLSLIIKSRFDLIRSISLETSPGLSSKNNFSFYLF